MNEPTEAAYDAAAKAFSWDLGHAPRRPDYMRSAIEAAVNAVWPLALAAGVAEGRRQAAAVAEAEAQEKRRLAKDALDRQHDGDTEAERHKLRFLAQAVALEQVAARIAEGTNDV